MCKTIIVVFSKERTKPHGSTVFLFGNDHLLNGLKIATNLYYSHGKKMGAPHLLMLWGQMDDNESG